ncbi:sensor histidine kinase [Romboutsia sp. Marseille-P6047]|uniref:sensor histidine kinase n=1 Tax=Romboutsia sp. Marseille-P6047 TaxID=2161817 RepID=UPI0013DDE791|nr:HAMP domain-containing sensor histidine kinase [Romboutsia sp. Marseille-P6047]
MNIIEKDYSDKRQNKKNIYIALTLIILSIVVAINTFLSFKIDVGYLEATLGFIKLFSFIISILGFISCLISYNRVKKDSIFIISLMYLGLSIDILLEQIDYLTFYNNELTIPIYITVSTSILRVLILCIALSKNNKLKSMIVGNKIKSIVFVMAYTYVLGIIEMKSNIFNFNKNASLYFILYNTFLATVYVMSSLRLFIRGMKEKEYIYSVLSSSIFILSIKAIFAIFALNRVTFIYKLVSVMLIYITYLIVIMGALIELYIRINKTNILNEKLSAFYNLVNNNKYSGMLIYSEEFDLLYANKRVMDYYLMKHNTSDLNKIEEISKNEFNLGNKSEEIINKLYENGVWRGIINSSSTNKVVDCWIQLMHPSEDKTEISVTYIDISEEIKMEIEVEKRRVYDKERSNFIANISHELKTPLNLFYSTTQLLDRFVDKKEEDFRRIYNKYNKTLSTNCNRMMRLIDNIMDLSSGDVGILNYKFKNYNIVSIIDYALLKYINIEFDTNEEDVIVKCDASMIERMILNLLSNAIKFSSENTRIFVNVFVNDDWVEIYIKDEGIGISKKDQEIIFNRFVQIDKSFTRINEGIGVGLSVVRSIVDTHNGNLYIDSDINKGSEFKIVLPNQRLEDLGLENYDVNTNKVEQELSDIYELLG